MKKVIVLSAVVFFAFAATAQEHRGNEVAGEEEQVSEIVSSSAGTSSKKAEKVSAKTKKDIKSKNATIAKQKKKLSNANSLEGTVTLASENDYSAKAKSRFETMLEKRIMIDKEFKGNDGGLTPQKAKASKSH